MDDLATLSVRQLRELKRKVGAVAGERIDAILAEKREDAPDEPAPKQDRDRAARRPAGQGRPEGRPIKMVLPLPPNRANNRYGHWGQRQQKKGEYFALCDGWMGTERCPRPPARPHGRVLVRATLYVWNRMDEGNALNRLKWTEDWIVEAGYVEDDNPDCWTWAGVPAQEIDRKEQRVSVCIIPLEGNNA